MLNLETFSVDISRISLSISVIICFSHHFATAFCHIERDIHCLAIHLEVGNGMSGRNGYHPLQVATEQGADESEIVSRGIEMEISLYLLHIRRIISLSLRRDLHGAR